MEAASVQTSEAHVPLDPGSSRLLSLDAFRGATIALMVLVNSAGGPVSYKPLEHSAWHGWTITDTVFPSFLWIVGVAITLSLSRRLDQGIPRSRLIKQIFRRSAILYLLGVALYIYPRFDLSTQRILGVLQRIAICYCIASLIYLFTSVRGQLLWIFGLYAAYWIIIFYAPVPGYGSGHLDVEHNFAHYVDQLLLGTHNYGQTKTWDPEGIVSTLPAIATTLLGIMAGHVLRLRTVLTERIVWLFLIGNALVATGLILDIWLPINKKLWTDSFSMFMAGLDSVILAMCLWVIDGLGYRRYVKPFVILGMNAIAIYLASEGFAEMFDWIHWHSAGKTVTLQEWIYGLFLTFVSPVNASLLYAIFFVMFMYVIAYALYRRKWFLRV